MPNSLLMISSCRCMDSGGKAMKAKYQCGQKVKLIAFEDANGRTDFIIEKYVNKGGTVIDAYYVSIYELPGVEYKFSIGDIYCYNVLMHENGELLEGIPETALELYITTHI